MSALADPLYFAFLNFLDATDTVQDEDRARIVGTYKLWRNCVDHEDEFVFGKLTVSEDAKSRALAAHVVVSRKFDQGLRGSRNAFSGYMFLVSRTYFIITRNSRTDDLRMTLFSRFKVDEVGTEINPRSVFAGRRHHIVHMDGLSLGIDGSRVFASPIHISLVDDVDELDRLDDLLDIVAPSDARIPPGVVKRLMRCGPLKVL